MKINHIKQGLFWAGTSNRNVPGFVCILTMVKVTFNTNGMRSHASTFGPGVIIARLERTAKCGTRHIPR